MFHFHKMKKMERFTLGAMIGGFFGLLFGPIGMLLGAAAGVFFVAVVAENKKIKQQEQDSSAEGGKTSAFLSRGKLEQEGYKQAGEEIISLVSKAAIEGRNLKRLENSLKRIASANDMDTHQMKAWIIAGWENAVNESLGDDILSEEEDKALYGLADHFSITQQDLDQSEAFVKLTKNGVLRDVFNGRIPGRNRVTFSGDIPFNLQRAEKLIWIFQNVDYYEDIIETSYVGGSHGPSIRIAKGLWYRANFFKGERLQEQETVYVDTGLLGVTNKHLYFFSPAKVFRVNYNKIVAFSPFEDGIGIHRDLQSAKPQSFVTNDGQFTYNLITNLARMYNEGVVMKVEGENGAEEVRRGGENSSVPTMNDFMRPILEYADKKGGEFSLREVVEAMADYFDLTPEARDEMTEGGSVTRVYDRTSWSIMHMKKANLLRSVRRGYYEITDLGREELSSD